MIHGLYVRRKGEGGVPLVLLHGFGGHHGDWTDIQPELARERQVLAYDLPGHGLSVDAPGAGSASAAAKAVLADLDARGLHRFHLVGFSMGGAIATLAALRAPQAIASLTLLAPGGYGAEINAPLLHRFAEAGNADELRACLDEMSAPQFRTLTRDVAGLAAVRFVPGMRERIREVVAAITKGGTQGQIPGDLIATIAAKVSVVWGNADPVLPYVQSASLPASWTLHTLPGVGHMMLNEARKATTTIIRNAAS